MRILIVEDEEPIAEDIKEICTQILRGRIESIHCELTLGNALHYLSEKQIDLLILDLNLSGRDGFDILKEAVSYSFHTIVISANIDRALEAFEYGVMDFIAKPYNQERIRKALDQVEKRAHFQNHNVKYLAVRRTGKIRLIALSEIGFIKGADVYSELYLVSGERELYDKTLNALSAMLPDNYLRIHKSYIVNLDLVKGIIVHGGGKYEAELRSGVMLPVSREKMRVLKNHLVGTS